MTEPPDKDKILRTVELVTPPSWHQGFIDNPAALATFRGNARTLEELAEVVDRSAWRQYFVAPPGEESAGFATRAAMSMTVTRGDDLDFGLVLAPGTILADGPRGRLYVNTEAIEWLPFDTDPITRTFTLECELLGEPGNLDWAAYPGTDLLLLPEGTDPNDPESGPPGTDIVDLQDRSQGRSDTGGVLTALPGQLSTLTDDGTAPTFSPTDVGLYVRLNYAGNTDNIGRVLRIAGFERGTPPPGSSVYPRTIMLDDGPLPQLVSAAQLDDGGAFTIHTTEARSSDPDDVPLLPAVPVVGDAFYVGADAPFTSLRIAVTTKRVGVLELAREYWDGLAWQALPDLDDPTDGFQIAGTRIISWSLPGAWPSTTVNAIDKIWIRFRVSAFTSQAQQPLAGRLIVNVPAPLAPDPLGPNGEGLVSWSILDARDLGLSITRMTAPAGGRDDDLTMKLRSRSVTQRAGESLDVLRRRAPRVPNVNAPALLEREINQVLNPYGQAGKIIEVGDGFTGLFWDVPTSFAPEVVGAWDLYEPGDAFPVDPTLLPLSDPGEARWHFFVCVPPPTLGEFGAAWDEGPVFFAPEFGSFLGPAWDYAFADGSPWQSEQLYKLVHERVSAAKMGGISFGLIQCDVPVCP